MPYTFKRGDRVEVRSSRVTEGQPAFGEVESIDGERVLVSFSAAIKVEHTATDKEGRSGLYFAPRNLTLMCPLCCYSYESNMHKTLHPKQIHPE